MSQTVEGDVADGVDAEAAPAVDGGPTAARRRSPMSRLSPGGSNPWVGRLVFVAFAIVLFLIPTILGDPTRTRQWAEYLCYAMIAVGIDIAWGYGGMLTLGQGVFFGLGAYSMGMYLSLEQVPDGQLPQFMSLYSDYTSLPWLWQPFQYLWFACLAAVIVPMLVAGALGFLVFRRRIRGPYFAILTQATALIMSLIVIGQLQLTAGTNGLTNFTTVFGREKYNPDTNRFLYYLAAGTLLVIVLIGWYIVRSRFGRLLVATRDAEDRVRFLGYDPALIKTVAFMVSAAMAGVAGALAAPIIGIVAPDQFDVLPSILMVCWVAVGGRGTLWGAVLGAILVSWTKTHFSESRPDDWIYLQGLLFIVVVGFIPGGVAGLLMSLGRRIKSLRPGREMPAPADGVVACNAPAADLDGAAMVASPVLEIKDLSVTFDGFKALDGVNFTVNQGEVRFVIGPNGAGKTTMIDCVTGLSKPTGGKVIFDGTDITRQKEHRIVRMGIGRSFQTPTVFEKLSVTENLDLAEAFRRSFPRLFARRRGRSDAVQATLERIGLVDAAELPAGSLSHGQKQWLEIGMLLVQGPKLMLLDELVAGMSPQERLDTGALLQELAVDHTIVVVEHDMSFLRRFASSVTVLHEGKILSEGSVAEVQADPLVREVYLGRSRDERSGALEVTT